jgi:hypothetical protein
MPLIYRILGYGGNGLLAVFGLLALLSGKAFWIGGFLAALGGINLYLIRKIDLYSREEAWLEAEVRKRELRRQIIEMDREDAADGTSGEPKRIPAADESQPPRG